MEKPAFITPLVDTISSLPGVSNIEGVTSDIDPKTWMIRVSLERSEEGWQALELLAWAINGYKVQLLREFREMPPDKILNIGMMTMEVEAAAPPNTKNSLVLVVTGRIDPVGAAFFVAEQLQIFGEG